VSASTETIRTTQGADQRTVGNDDAPDSKPDHMIAAEAARRQARQDPLQG